MTLSPILRKIGDEYVVSNIAGHSVKYLAQDMKSGNLLLLLLSDDEKDYRVFAGTCEKGIAECKISDREEDEYGIGLALCSHPFPGKGCTVLIDPKSFPDRLPALHTLAGSRNLRIEKFLTE